MIAEQRNECCKEEEAKINSQQSCKDQLNELIESSKERYEYFIKCCISQQIRVLESLFYFIIKSSKQIDAWEQQIYDIVQISETQLSHLHSHFNTIDSNLLTQLEGEQIEWRKNLENIIFYSGLDLKKQKKSPLEQQLQSLKTQLKDMKNVLRLNKNNINEYFQKDEEQEEIQTELVLTEEQKDMMFAHQICQNDLFEEFGVTETRTQQDNIENEKGNEVLKSEFYQIIQEGLMQMKQKDAKKAEQLFEQAIRLDPNNPKAHHCKANSLSLQYSYQEAIDSYEKAVELDPNYQSCYLNYVRHIDADELTSKIKEKFPANQIIHYFFELSKCSNISKRNEEDIFD